MISEEALRKYMLLKLRFLIEAKDEAIDSTEYAILIGALQEVKSIWSECFGDSAPEEDEIRKIAPDN